MLKVEGLNVSIQSVRILRGAHFEVGRSQFVGLIGRNGAGKTTLFRSIMGILHPSAGGITFEGKSLRGVPGYARARLGIGYMPEDRRLIPDLTVEENVLLPGWATGMKNAAERLARIYQMIPEVKEQAPRKGLQLSGGQQKLVALARALMSGTKLLLLDEPFEGVAPVLARRLAEVITRLKTEGLSVVIAESDLSHAQHMLEVIFPIDRGEVGPPSSPVQAAAHGGAHPPLPPPSAADGDPRPS